MLTYRHPLHIAAQTGNLNLCKRCLAFGLNPNAVSKELTTPLLFATKHQHPELIKLLLKYGAHSLQRNAHGAYAEKYATTSELKLLFINKNSSQRKKELLPLHYSAVTQKQLKAAEHILTTVKRYREHIAQQELLPEPSQAMLHQAQETGRQRAKRAKTIHLPADD